MRLRPSRGIGNRDGPRDPSKEPRLGVSPPGPTTMNGEQMRRGCVRSFALTACAVTAAFAAGCGSSSSSSSSASAGSGSTTSTSSSGAAASGANKGKIAIVASRSLSSNLGKPATDAAVLIKGQLGNPVTTQGSLTQSQVLPTLEGYAARGYPLVIVDGAEMQQQATVAAKSYPKTKFVVVNGNAAASPNLSSATYSWEQSGFLAGIVAGLTTKTNKVSTMSTIKIPPIEGLYYGFQQGVKQVNPKAQTINTYTGTFSPDLNLAANLTSTQGSKGNDVVFTVATDSDPGVFRGAAQSNMKVVGYGVNEANLGPRIILSSTLVNYAGTMLTMARLFNEGQLQPKVYTYGFKDHAFALAPLTNMPEETAKQIRSVSKQAIDGKFEIKTLSSNF